MIEIVWECVVKEASRGQLGLAFGPGGAWSNLFAGRVGFHGTTVLRDTENPLRHLIIDIWDSLAQWEQTLSRSSEEYSRLEATFAGWTESRQKLGVFQVRSEASVRPRGRAGRSSRGMARKGKRVASR
jgi:hypothetical protein